MNPIYKLAVKVLTTLILIVGIIFITLWTVFALLKIFLWDSIVNRKRP